MPRTKRSKGVAPVGAGVQKGKKKRAKNKAHGTKAKADGAELTSDLSKLGAALDKLAMPAECQQLLGEEGGASAEAPHRVVLSLEDCSLDLVVGRSRLCAATLTSLGAGFCYLFSGGRATCGVSSGRWYFECRLGLPLNAPDLNERGVRNKHTCRIGWSEGGSGLQLGEEEKGGSGQVETANAFGYGAMTGFLAQHGKFRKYGERCVPGDVIGCFLDLEDGTARFTRNGQDLGEAVRQIPRGGKEGAGTRYFPHVLLRNMTCAFNFGALPPWCPPPASLAAWAPLERAAAAKDSDKEAAAAEAAAVAAEGAHKAAASGVPRVAEGVNQEEVGATEGAAAAQEAIAADCVAIEGDEDREDGDGDREDGDEDCEDGNQEEGGGDDGDVAENVEDTGEDDGDEDKALVAAWMQAARASEGAGEVQEAEKRVPLPLPLDADERPELVMMVGLPASGKTRWAQQHVRVDRGRRSLLVGTDSLMEQMQRSAPATDGADYNKWHRIFYPRAEAMLQLLLQQVIPARRRSVVLDQTNVYRTARNRKLAGVGAQFRRVAVVCVVDEAEQAWRLQRHRERGKDVPWSTLRQMCENFTLPTCEEGFDEVIYTELPEEPARAVLERMKRSLGSSKTALAGGPAESTPPAAVNTKPPGQKGGWCEICGVAVSQGKGAQAKHEEGRKHRNRLLQRDFYRDAASAAAVSVCCEGAGAAGSGVAAKVVIASADAAVSLMGQGTHADGSSGGDTTVSAPVGTAASSIGQGTAAAGMGGLGSAGSARLVPQTAVSASAQLPPGGTGSPVGEPTKSTEQPTAPQQDRAASSRAAQSAVARVEHVPPAAKKAKLGGGAGDAGPHLLQVQGRMQASSNPPGRPRNTVARGTGSDGTPAAGAAGTLGSPPGAAGTLGSPPGAAGTLGSPPGARMTTVQAMAAVRGPSIHREVGMPGGGMQGAVAMQGYGVQGAAGMLSGGMQEGMGMLSGGMQGAMGTGGGTHKGGLRREEARQGRWHPRPTHRRMHMLAMASIRWACKGPIKAQWRRHGGRGATAWWRQWQGWTCREEACWDAWHP
ncbi:hypothetical protein CYMTET_39303 [Cymbomonas tetramitiformis]|uniref:B30.2/SPRY domain-containing protein n=1 Tax=Cymbomonas tetramitiformis TaxID=36881 RepID=A0AAE0CAC4_9CHLO|nr:hypothetical protein CYMTET_39303 [Cymbomonas tetramitiformis]